MARDTMTRVRYRFDWSRAKATANFRKHGVTFEAYRIQETPMKAEYDFSQAERGKFYREGAIFILPAYLDDEVTERLSALAKAKGTDPSEMANAIVRRALAEMEAVESGK